MEGLLGRLTYRELRLGVENQGETWDYRAYQRKEGQVVGLGDWAQAWKSLRAGQRWKEAMGDGVPGGVRDLAGGGKSSDRKGPRRVRLRKMQVMLDVISASYQGSPFQVTLHLTVIRNMHYLVGPIPVRPQYILVGCLTGTHNYLVNYLKISVCSCCHGYLLGGQ